MKSTSIRMKPLIAANWKMNKSIKEADSFIKEFNKFCDSNTADIVICPPFTIMPSLSGMIKGTGIKLGSQNMHFEERGAFTGEISPLMVRELNCEYVIIGHSERRQYFKEDDALINKKVKSALNHGLKPILCVGETLEQRQSKSAMKVIKNQIAGCLNNVDKYEMKNIVIAYEPVWAIGTGKNATPEQAQEVHAYIKKLLSEIYSDSIASKVRIIYGGSVKPENAKELLSMKDIYGALVGGASLDAKSFAAICNSV